MSVRATYQRTHKQVLVSLHSRIVCGSAGNSLGTPPAHLRATASPPPDAPSVAWGVRSPRGSRATRVVGGGAPPPEQERAPKQCISCPNVHQTRLIQWVHLYHVSEEVWTPSPGNGTGAAGGLGRGARTPSQGVRPGPPGVPHPPVRRWTALRWAGGGPSELPALL